MSDQIEFEAVIGLEVHCQLATASKLFSPAPARMADGVSVADIAPNVNTDPITAGHPGTLPVLNKKAVEYAILAGLGTNCTINTTSVFSRKNYFYPDLPKGYQISQYDKPICENGHLTIRLKSGTKKINIERIHIEEDAGKNVHMTGFSVVNLNRAGVPLVEIVSKPELRSSEEAGEYLRALHAIVTYLGVCDGNMQEGNFRCDANVSVMPKGSDKFGTRTEIKNVNSFRFVEKAIDYEITRQIAVIRSGGRVVLETRLYDPDQNVTVSMRSKEEAHDYRYFPDPDLLPLRFSQTWVNELKSAMPELPEKKRERFMSELGLSDYDAQVLTGSKPMAEFFEKTLELLKANGESEKQLAKPVANFLAGEIARRVNETGVEVNQSKLTPTHLAEVVLLVQSAEISSTGAKTILNEAWSGGETIATIVDREGLRQVSDLGALEPVIVKVITANPKQVEEFKSGKDKLIGFFVGQVMKETGGKANPALLQELIKKKILGG